MRSTMAQATVWWWDMRHSPRSLDRHEMGTYLARFGLILRHDIQVARPQGEQGPQVVLAVMDASTPLTSACQALLAFAARHIVCPLMVVVEQGGAGDRACLLEHGVDDCMAGPFEPRELVARLHALLRRRQRPTRGPMDLHNVQRLRIGPWLLDTNRRCLLQGQRADVALSNAEFRLLMAFLRAPFQIISRDRLMDEARGRHLDAFERSIDLLISRLRHKLGDDPRQPRLIATIRGQGYVMNIMPEGAPELDRTAH